MLLFSANEMETKIRLEWIAALQLQYNNESNSTQLKLTLHHYTPIIHHVAISTFLLTIIHTSPFARRNNPSSRAAPSTVPLAVSVFALFDNTFHQLLQHIA